MCVYNVWTVTTCLTTSVYHVMMDVQFVNLKAQTVKLVKKTFSSKLLHSASKLASKATTPMTLTLMPLCAGNVMRVVTLVMAPERPIACHVLLKIT